jgi:hypothetical protein
MRSFEAIFRVPVAHHLNLVRSKARGGIVRGEYWEHEELDGSGQTVARYETFCESNGGGSAWSGWRKYDPNGRLIEAQEPAADLLDGRERSVHVELPSEQ